MNKPFQPTELAMKPLPKQQTHFRINIKLPEQDLQVLQQGEPLQTEELEEQPMPVLKSVIIDKRKFSNIERSLVLDRIRCRNPVVNVVVEEFPELKSCEKPIGEPSTISMLLAPIIPHAMGIKKLEKEVVLREPGILEQEKDEIYVETREPEKSLLDEEEEK